VLAKGNNLKTKIMITKFILVAVFLFLAFRVAHVLHRFFNYQKIIKYHMNYLIPLAELIAWLAFWIWIVAHFYLNNNNKILVLIAITFALIAVPAFFLLRNFIFGVYLKIQGKFDKGDAIEFDDFEGEIIKLGNFNIEIKDAQGDIKSIPYSKIKSDIFTKHGANSNLKKQVLTFRFTKSLTINSLQKELLKQIMNSPWVAISQPPFIERIKTEETSHIIEVVVFTLKNEHVGYIQEMVEKAMNKA
jgi:hypothetical protein